MLSFNHNFFHRSQQYDPSNPATNENPHWEQARKALEKTQAESNKKKANQENAVQNNAHMGVMNNPNAAYYYQQVSYFQNQWVFIKLALKLTKEEPLFMWI